MLCNPVFPVTAQDDVPEVVLRALEAGDRHREAGRIDQAVESYEEARRLGPEVLEVYTSLGAAYHSQGELVASLEAFEAGLQHFPRDRGLLFNAAVTALRLDRLEKALGHAEGALELRRSDIELLSLRSSILARLGRLEEALEDLETADRRQRNNPQVLFRLGNLYHQLGRPDDAIEAYQKAIDRNSDLGRAYYNLGAVLFEQERFDEAEKAYVVALEPVEKAFARGEAVDPVHARAYSNLGAIYFRRQDWNPALDAYTRAAQLDPDSADALYNQGNILFQMGDHESARRAHEKALALEPELPLAYLQLGQIAARAEERRRAVQWLQEGLPRLSGDARLSALELLAGVHEELGERGEARGRYQELLAARPDDSRAALALGRLLRQDGETAEARKVLEAARQASADPLRVTLELAALAQVEGRDSDERSLYEELVAGENPAGSLWPVRLRLVIALLRQGEIEAVRGHLAELTAMPRRAGGPGIAERRLLSTLRGLLLANDGELAAAREILSTEAGGDDFPPAAAALTVLSAVGGDLDSARDGFRTVVDGAGGDPALDLWKANWGQVAWLTGRSEEARPLLSAAAEALPRWASLQAALAGLELETGNAAGAIDGLTTAAELCAARAGAPLPGLMDTFSAVVRAEGQEGLCRWVDRALGHSQVAEALRLLTEQKGRGASAAGELASRALQLPLGARDQAVAHYVRGTTRLVSGSFEASARDLSAAVAGGLPEALEGAARNNLAVAWSQQGRVDAARQQLRAADEAGTTPPAAYLNLGVLLEKEQGDLRRALDLYRQYLRSGGQRRQEVGEWVEALERIYP